MSPSLYRLLAACAAVAMLGTTVANAAPALPPGKTKPPPLTIPMIMQGEAFIGYKPSTPRWSLDSKMLYFRWKQPGEPRTKEEDWYVVPADSSAKPRKLTDTETRTGGLLPPSGDLTHDHQRLLFTETSDIFLLDAATMTRRRLTHTGDGYSDVHWTADEKHLTYQQGGNLYRMAVEGDEPIEKLTSISTTPAGGEEAPRPPFGRGRGGGGNGGGGNGDAVTSTQERDLFSALRDRAAQGGGRRRFGRQNGDEPRRKSYTPPSRLSVTDLTLSPDGAQVLVRLYEPPATSAKTSVVPAYVTESGYVEANPARPNVGAPHGTTRYVLLDVRTGDSLPLTVPDSLKSRTLSFGEADWSEGAPARLLVSADATDHHDRWLFTADRATGKMALVFDAHDDAWVGELNAGNFGWMPDGKHVWVQTENKTGWSHLALLDPDTSASSEIPLTTGSWELSSPQFSRDRSRWYFASSEADLGETHWYTMPLGGGPRTRLTNLPGGDDVTPSPDETRLAYLHSYTNQPPELYVQKNEPGAPPVRVTHSTTAQWESYHWRDVPVITYPARDGFAVHARLFTPTGKANHGAVIFAHGAGYLQNADHKWSYYEHEYLFNHFLADHGYTILDIDYRGSAGYGRNCRTAIYKHMGGKDLEDLEDGVRFLTQTHGVDPKRIGIYGGSYGGFLSLMALFTMPDTFTAGAALRPVSDWSKYNDGYTSEILGLPTEDPAAYHRSSPIYFAQNLKGALLICHGMQDSNVFFQDSIRLAQRLIELGKDNWQIAPYPVEDHSFTEPSSWTDEYKRIYRFFEQNLRNEK